MMVVSQFSGRRVLLWAADLLGGLPFPRAGAKTSVQSDQGGERPAAAHDPCVC